MGSKRELIKTVEQQQEKLEKYETRLRDVVHAYKGLLKEKEALESSLAALAATKPNEKIDIVEQLDKTSSETEKNEVASTSKNLGDAAAPEEDSSDSKNEVEKLKHQIVTLTNALSTLTAEKTRIESNFQADRKRLRQEKEACDQKLEKQKVGSSNRHAELTKEFNELKMKLKSQQQERDKEESHHALMLRELQKLVSVERMSKEYLQEKLDETQVILKKREKKLDEVVDYEKKLEEMSKELQELRERLQMSEDASSKPSPLLIDLQSQMDEMKTQHLISFQRERLRADEAENKLMSGTGANEDRVAALEQKLSELSNLIGNYDRLRNQDQQAIVKLKDHVEQLEKENATLAKVTKTLRNSSSKDASEVGESHLTVQELIDRISKLKGLLKAANQRAEFPVNIDDVLKTDYLSVIQNQNAAESSHTQCQIEVRKVKDEFEKYKLKIQSVLKNKVSDDNNKEFNSLTNQMSEMKERIYILRSQLDKGEHDHQSYIFELKESFAHTENSLKKRINEIQDECQFKILNMDKQMQSQRERTQALLEEKDEELNNLKLSSSSYRKVSKSRRNELPTYSMGADGFQKDTDVISMLSHSKGANKSETQILHYQQEISRLNVEISALRKAKHDLEHSLREMQNASLTKEDKYSDQVYDLQAKVNRLKSSQEESVNLEYLKNVVVNFMCCANAEGKLHMLNAISAILHFTPKELSNVKQHIYGT